MIVPVLITLLVIACAVEGVVIFQQRQLLAELAMPPAVCVNPVVDELNSPERPRTYLAIRSSIRDVIRSVYVIKPGSFKPLLMVVENPNEGHEGQYEKFFTFETVDGAHPVLPWNEYQQPEFYDHPIPGVKEWLEDHPSPKKK